MSSQVGFARAVRSTVPDDREHGPVRLFRRQEDPTLIQADYNRLSGLDTALDAITGDAQVASGCTDLFAFTSRPRLRPASWKFLKKLRQGCRGKRGD